MVDVVVIGGGIAGLTAAAFAARSGAETMLLEANRELGGRAATREIEGFRFNVGPHALYLGGAAMSTLAALGLEPAGSAPVGSGSWYVRAGALHRMPVDAAALASSSLLKGLDKLRLGRAFRAIAKGYRGRPGDTVAQAIDGLTTSPVVRSVVQAQVRVSTYSNASEFADAAAVFDQLRLAYRGVRYLDGGWATMIASLEEAARAAGSEVCTAQRATTVSHADDGWHVTLAGGATIGAAAVILAVSPKQAFELAPGLELLSRICTTACPVRAASLDVALSNLPRPDHTFALGLDEPTYFSVHSATARELAPQGAALIHVARYLAPGEKPSSEVRANLESLLDLLQPGWREVLVHAQWLPQVNVTQDQPQAALGGLGGRPSIEVDSGLLLAGDWVGDAGMLADAAFASGRRAGEIAGALTSEKRRAA